MSCCNPLLVLYRYVRLSIALLLTTTVSRAWLYDIPSEVATSLNNSIMPTQEPVAIIGYAYRAPGIGRKGLWDLLEDGKSGWSKVPPERFDQDAYYSPEKDKAGCFAVAGAHFLPDDIYAFDAAFFNIRQDEARAMDPQHRLILETAFEAAEHAGLTIGELAGTDVGVFAANESSEYYAQSLDDLPTTSKYTATATAACMFANRLSYFLDLVSDRLLAKTSI